MLSESEHTLVHLCTSQTRHVTGEHPTRQAPLQSTDPLEAKVLYKGSAIPAC